MTRLRLCCIGLLALAFNSASGQDSDSRLTRGQAEAILSELKQIRQLLERQQSRPVQPLSGKSKIEGGDFLGDKSAPVTMIEFTDYECQFCRQFEASTFGAIRKRYVDSGRLRIVVRNLPLSIHPSAMRAAQAAFCAGDQGQFWGMHDLLFAGSAENLAMEGILQNAQKLPIDIPTFKACLVGGKHIPDVLKDMQDAAALQLSGTPSFLIGRTNADGVEGSILMGAQPLPVFEVALAQALVGK